MDLVAKRDERPQTGGTAKAGGAGMGRKIH
jgi:hypothetical protein